MALKLEEQIEEIKAMGDMHAVIFSGPTGLKNHQITLNQNMTFEVIFGYIFRNSVECFIGSASIVEFEDVSERYCFVEPSIKRYLLFEGHEKTCKTPVWGLYGLDTETGILVWNSPCKEDKG